MSESLDGVSFSVTRQNAGIVVNAAVAVGFVAFGGANAPACTDSADSTRPFVTFACASDSHGIGPGAVACNGSSVVTPAKAITAAILMRGSVDPNTPIPFAAVFFVGLLQSPRLVGALREFAGMKETPNYITPAGFARLREELAHLWKVERPPVVATVAWAAGNGDRSENGDYIYGKQKLRQIDRRIRYLSKRLDSAVVVDNAGKAHERVYFGATVTFAHEGGDERTVTIVGVDELDAGDSRISWRSPMATAMLKARVGDVVTLRTPRGPERIEVLAIRYDAFD
jgi:transcription elongation factor GreB